MAPAPRLAPTGLIPTDSGGIETGTAAAATMVLPWAANSSSSMITTLEEHSPAPSYLSSSFAHFPTGGPCTGLFLSFAQQLNADQVMLKSEYLSPMARSALSWLSTSNMPSAMLLPGSENSSVGHFSSRALNGSLGQSLPAGVLCSEDGENGTAGNITWVFWIALLVLLVLVIDIFECCGMDFSRIISKHFEEPTGSTGAPVDGDPDDTASGTPKAGATPSTELASKPAKVETKPPKEDEAAAAAAEGPDSDPKTISIHGWMIIGVTLVPPFIGDLYFSMLAPFFPGQAEYRGVGQTMIGLIFAMHPIGSICTGILMPWVLRQEWADTYVFLRRATAVNALATCFIGMVGLVPAISDGSTAVAFTLPLMFLRFVQGVCVTFTEVSNEVIVLMNLPRAYIGPVQGFIMATRTLGIIAGPVLGGFLYLAGCWALPFTIGAMLLTCAFLFLMLVLSRRAPPRLKAKKDLTGLQLMKTGDIWLVCIPMLCVCMMISFLEPSWQGFLGRAPFEMTPSEIGIFLQQAVVVYMIVLIVSGMTMSCCGAAVQFMIGTILGGIGLLLLGPSPWFGGAIPQTEGTALMGLMICYAGIGIVVPAMVPISLDIFEAAGYTQTQVAGASAAMFAIVIPAGNALGPPLGGFLIEVLHGLPWTATVYFCLIASVAVPCVGVLVFKYAKRPEKGCAAAPRHHNGKAGEAKAAEEEAKAK